MLTRQGVLLVLGFLVVAVVAELGKPEEYEVTFDDDKANQIEGPEKDVDTYDERADVDENDGPENDVDTSDEPADVDEYDGDEKKDAGELSDLLGNDEEPNGEETKMQDPQPGGRTYYRRRRSLRGRSGRRRSGRRRRIWR